MGTPDAPRRHHLVPELYLRRFADERDQLRVVSRTDVGHTFPASVGDMPVERDFYAFETIDGEWSLELEKQLATFEGAAAGAIGRILQGEFPPSPSDREYVAAFVALQWLRGADMRAAYDGVQEHIAKLYLVNMTRAQARQAIEQGGREATEEAIEEMVRFAEDHRKYGVAFHQNGHIGAMLEMWPGITRLAYARKWQLLRLSEGAFLTSDAPVSLWTAPKNHHPFWGGGGFGPCDEIAIPLDRRHALTLLHEAPSGEAIINVGSRHASALNWRTAKSGRRWVFHHPDDTPLAGIDPLPPPRLKISADSEPFRIVPGDV